MKYYIVSENIELMRSSYFIYRKTKKHEDSIVALVEDEYAQDEDLIKAMEKLLALEGEYRNQYNKWDSPPINLDVMFLPRYSL